METLKFFLLFLTAVESASCRRTNRSYAYLQLIETLSREFHGHFQIAAYENKPFKATEEEEEVPAEIEFSEVANKLNGMIGTFMTEGVRNYVLRRLSELCDLAARLVDGDYPANSVRERLGFPDDCVYCVIAPIHESGDSVKETFEFVYLLRSIIRRDERCPMDALRSILDTYRTIIHGELPEGRSLLPSSWRLSPDHTADVNGDVVRRLSAVKREFENFSKTFCPWWSPIVSNDFLWTPVADEVRAESLFVRYVYFNEKCRILAGDILYEENTTSNWWEDYPLLVDEWIMSWDCSNILETVVSAGPKPKFNFSKKFSLAELKELLKSKPNYQNALKYNNIVMDVTLMASIKEGVKVIRGITLVARWSCSAVTNDNTVDTIRGLRPMWSVFKSVFDELLFVVLTRNKNTADLRDIDYQMSCFEQRVKSFARYLDVRDDVAKQQYCRGILEDDPEDTNGDVYPADNPIGVLKFRGHYFDEPIFHVKQLYRIRAYGF